MPLDSDQTFTLGLLRWLQSPLNNVAASSAECTVSFPLAPQVISHKA